MLLHHTPSFSFFFFNDTATTEIYTLSLHDALPIFLDELAVRDRDDLHDTTPAFSLSFTVARYFSTAIAAVRSEEHTSELQSLAYLVCRLLLEKKKRTHTY